MKVIGTAVIRFEIEIGAEDLSENSMTMYESDELIAHELDKKLPVGMYVNGDIFVDKTIKK